MTNTGNIDLTGISVTDANATVVPATTIDLVAGAVDNSTYTASYIITAGDITAGNFSNTAVASAPNPLGGAAVTDNSDDPNDATDIDPNNDGSPDDPTVTDLRQPLLDITKTSTGVVDTNGNGIIDAGDTINYTFVVTNTGNIDLTGISVTDANATVVPATTIDLVVGAVDNSTYTASYIITAGDITAGNFSNTAVASAPNPLGGAAVTDNSDDPNDATDIDPNNDGSPDDPTVTDLRQPLLDITKTSTGVVDTNGNGIIDAGDTINYTFVVTNTGNIDLTGIGVTDANATVVPATTIDLIVGAVDNSTYTASYIITAGDITAGTFNNQAVASALNPLNPLGPPVTDNSDDPTDATNVDPNNDGSPDDVTTTDLRQPLLDITKTSTGVVDTNANGIIDAGDTINYTFVVTNTGNIDLTGISVTDANATVVPATTIDLVVGAVDNSTYTASYIITAGDITAGNFTNTAVASAPNPLGGAAVTDNSDDPNDATNVDPNNDGSPDDPTVTDLRQPLLDITKTSTGVVDTNGNGIIDAGDTINYTFVVTNTGNIDLTGIGVTDANATVVPATTIDLIVGAVDNSTYTASYIITAGDITAGTFNNQAVASALNPLNPLGPPVTDNSDDPTDATNVDPNNDGSPDDVTTTDLRQPLLDITKTSTGVVDTNGNGIIDAGDTINYTFVVTNTGNIDLTGISVTDANATVTPATTIDLVVGAVDNSTYTASYIITAGDITAGNFSNTAVASAPNPLGGAAVTDNSDDPNNATNVDPNNDGSPDDPTVTDLRQPLLDITKTSTGVVDTNGNGIIDAGDTINYTFVVTNTGNIDLTGIGVTDANATVVPATTIDLVVGAVDNSTYTASYIITAGDITAGTFNNQAVASALNPLNPLGPPVTDNSDDPTDATNVDPNNDGSPDDVTTTDLRQPLLDITKTSTGVVDTNGNGIIDAGDTINYTFVVTNTGNIDLTGISVTDANATVVPATTIDLVVGAVDNSTYTASYIITAGDITAGNFTNTAVASAPNPLGGAAVTDNSDDPNDATDIDPNNDGSPDDPTVTDLRQPLLDITKTSTGVVDTNGNGIIDAGDTINYTFVVTNTGNIDLTGIGVTDANATVVPATTIDLIVGAVDNSTYTASYIITAGDITAGTFNNQAVASALNPLNPLGPPVTDNSDDPTDATNVDPNNDGSPDDVTTTDLRQPLLDITKTSTGVVDTNANGIIDAGDTINYTFVVTNTGNIDLTGISVTDANATVVPATTIDLVVGAVDNSTYTASYIITAGDITAGNFTNTAVASAPNPLGGAAVTDNSDDPNDATNVDPNNDGSPDDPTVTDLRQPLLDITKTSTGVVDTNGNGIIDAGDTINYTFVVTNTGNIDLTGIGVTDANATVVPATTIDLIVGAVDNSTYTASYIITAGDITAGTFNNQAVASALNPLNPLGPPVTDNSDDPTDATNVDPNNDGSPDDVTTTDLRQPLLDITKTSTGVVDTNGNGIIDAGDTINYTFVVTNTGNIDLTGISVTDANATVTPATTIDLVVGAVDNSTYTASYIITAGDITAGNFSNTAVASAPNPLGGAAVTDNSDDPNNATNVDPNNDGSPDDPTVTDLRQPLLDITKTSTGVVDTNGNGIIDAGDTINYTFVVTNTGNIDLTGIGVTDANATVVPATTIDLVVGAVDNSTYTASYIITAGDITAGTFNNQAVASALNPLNPLGPPVTDNSDDPTDATNVDPNNDGSPDDVTTTDLRQPLLDITKTSTGVVDTNGNGIIDAGDTINYTFVVTNTGNIDLTGISVTDANATVVPATTIDLVVGAVDNSTYTASYIITAGDITAGNFTNTAVASAPNPLGGAAVTDNSDDPNNPTNVDPNNDGSPDDPTVTDLRQPLLDITKTSTGVVDTNGNGIIDAGDTINYTFVVTNTGNIDLTGIGVTDANATVVPATTIDLVVGAVDNSTYTASYIITAGDITAGTFNNQAVASALNPLNPLGPPVTDNSDDPTDATNVDPNNDGSPDDPTVTDLRQPLLDITKTSTGVVDTNGNGIIDAGDTINYTFVVTNTGNIDLTGISVTDANATVVPATTIDLVVGAVDNSTYTASYIITAGDITAGNFSNTAVASAPNPLGGAAVTDNSDDPNNATNVDPNNDGSPDDPTVTDLRQPLLDITKTSTGVVDTNGNGIIDAGDTINYTFVVTNTGNIDLTGISVTDANATVVPATTIDLVVGAVDNSTYTASYIITAGDITAGNFSNTAVASAPNPLGGAAVTDNSDDPNDATDIDPNNDGSPDDPTVTDLRQPLLDITKTSTGVVDTNGNGIIDAGDTINYTFVVTNTGNIDLTGISVTDANATVVPATTIDLVVGAVDNSTYTASYIITAGDITAGNFSNTAVASAPNPLGGAAVTDNSDDPNDATDIDPNNDGSPDDPTVTDLRQPLLDITKTSTGVVDTNGNGIIDAGDTINYTFVVTNTGNIDLTGIGVTDANATVVPATTIDLIVGAVDNSTYTASYIITAGDITAGTFNNQAVASALNPLNPLGPPVTDNSDDPTDATNVDPNNDGSPDDVTTTDLRQPLLDITKTSTGVVDTNGNGIIDAGDTINYTFVVTNTGNIDLTGISVTDANATVVPATTIDLVVGAVDNSTYTASYIITAGDITAGNFTNTAVASAPNPLGGAAVTDNSDDPNNPTNVDPNNDGSPDDPTVTDLRQPLLDITKTSTGVVDTNGNGIIDAGDTINYTFVVTNTGNIDLTGISVTDANATVVPATTIDLIVGAVDNSTYTASYIITAGDITAGTFNNQAVVSALNPLNPLGPPVTDNSDDPTDATNVDPNNDGSPDDVTTTDLRQPLLDITKTSTGVVDTNGNGIIDAGDTINYTFVVTNTGNIDLTGISVTDANATVTPATTIDLVVGAVDNSTYTASYIITAGDITAGNFTNTAVASAPNPLGGAAVTDNSDDPNNPTNVDPNNDGSPDDPTVTDLRQPLLDITKTGTLDDANFNGFADVGENINYTFVVTNTGNIDLTGISITDANATVTPATTIDLVAGAVDNSTYTAIHTLTQAEINSGSYINQAVASAPNPLGGAAVTDNSDDPNDATDVDPNNDGSPDDLTVITLTPNPMISITKADNLPADGSYDTVGEAILYTIEVTNNGNVTLTNIVLTDPNADTIVPSVIASIDPGQTVIATATHVITQADIDLGTVTNIASVSAEDPNTTPVNDDSDDPDTPAPDDATITIIDQNPELTLTKMSDTPTDGAYDTVGEVITYTLEVINTGTVTINNIVVTDLNADSGSVTPSNIATLAPGGRITVTAAHSITQLDLDAGIVINRADVVGETPGGIPVTDMSDDPTTPDPNDATETETGLVTIGRLSVTKSANLRVFTAIGDVITYTIEIENTGTVTLSNVTVIDDNATIISGLPITTLVPGEVTTVIAEHVVTQADILVGQVVNIAEVTGVTPTSETITETSDDPNNSDNDDPDLDGDPDDPTISVIDSDGDGIPDPDDMDDDNDGITDIEEQNGDPNLDTDGDGVIDRLDLDADGDGVLDVYESGANLDGLSISDIGRIEGTVGTDGIPDGVQNVGEFDSGNVNYPIQDTDGDGRDDFQDIDDDNDDILTVDENPDPSGDGNPDDAFDTDGNGIPDYLEPNGPTGEGEDGITVFTGMSPNGDGVNDVFIISGIERLENTLEIYNRWGVKVYGTKNYGRDDQFFRGISKGRTTIEGTDQLPVGTYYYVLEYVLESGERKSRAGYLYINR